MSPPVYSYKEGSLSIEIKATNALERFFMEQLMKRDHEVSFEATSDGSYPRLVIKANNEQERITQEVAEELRQLGV